MDIKELAKKNIEYWKNVLKNVENQKNGKTYLDEEAPVKKPKNVGFDEFWSSYPKKVNKIAAMRAWKNLTPDEETRQTIQEDITKRKYSDLWQKDGGTFIPHPTTYLNGRRWEDSVEITKPTFKKY